MKFKINTNKIVLYYFNLTVILSVFFITWGEGLQNISPYISKLFPFFAINVIFYAFIFLGFKIKFYRPFYLFVLFLLLHVMVYMVFNYNEISFGVASKTYMHDSFVKVNENKGNEIFRLFLFLFYSISLTKVFVNNRLLFKYSFVIYSFGFLSTLVLGGYSAIYGTNEERISAGFMDPNALGFSCLIVFYLSFYLIKKTNSKYLKILNIVIMVISIVALFATLSRGSLLGFIVGLCVYFFMKFNIKLVIVLLLISPLILKITYALLPRNAKSIIDLRLSIDRLKEDQGAGRAYIWKDYFRNLDKFFIVGTGIANSRNALIGNYTYKLQVTHNQYLLMFVQFGILGISLFLYYMYTLVRFFHKWRSLHLIIFSLLIAILINMFTIDVDAFRDFWYAIAIFNTIYLLTVNGDESINLQ